MSTDETKLVNTENSNKLALNQVNLKIIYESGIAQNIYQCYTTEILKTILIKFCTKIEIKYSSIYVLYSGILINDEQLNKPIDQIISSYDKENKLMTILVYQNETPEENDKIKLKLIIENQDIFLEANPKQTIEEIFKTNKNKIPKELTTLKFLYQGKEININQKLENIMIPSDKDNSLIIITSKPKLNPIIRPVVTPSIGPQNRINNTQINITNTRNTGNTDTIRNLQNNSPQINPQVVQAAPVKSKKCEEKCVCCVIWVVLIIGAIIGIIIYFVTKKKCKEGYFFPDDYDIIDTETKCEKCSIKGCKKCKGNVNNNKCTDCGSLEPVYKYEEILECKEHNYNDDTDNNESKETTKVTSVITCSKGYFLPDDYNTCKKCSLEGCEYCKGIYQKDECTDCGKLEPLYEFGKIIKCKNYCEIGLEEKCLTCNSDKSKCNSCNDGYYLKNGKCKPDFYIKAIYETKIPGINIKLFEQISPIDKVIIDGNTFYYIDKYLFEETGEHIVFIKFDMVSSTSVDGFFSGNKYLKSVTFSNLDDGLNNKKIPNVNFVSLFKNCENLISVDFSRIAYNYSAYLNNMFEGCTNLQYVNFNIKTNFRVKEAKFTFYNCISLMSLDLSKLNVSETTTFESFFEGCISLNSVNLNNWKFSKTYISMTSMFKNCTSLKNLDLSMIKVEKIYYLDNMFSDCISLESINLSGWKLDSAYRLSYMFSNCISLKYLDLSSFRPNKLEYIDNMFYNCHSLTSINLEKFYTSEVTNMENLFYNCTSLKIINLTSFYSPKVSNMKNVFKNCISLTSIIFGQYFTTSAVKYMNSFFENCFSLSSINLEIFDTSLVEYFNGMFRNCYNLQKINISSFRFKSGSNFENMFSGCYSLTSINFLNGATKIYNYDGIFHDCPNLSYINFSFVNDSSYYKYRTLINENISDSGVIILNTGFYNKISIYQTFPSNWIITLK